MLKKIIMNRLLWTAGQKIETIIHIYRSAINRTLNEKENSEVTHDRGFSRAPPLSQEAIFLKIIMNVFDELFAPKKLIFS